jgi:O-acetyl-ADP-ribose deacetylase (regulator of RNase III)
MIRTNIWILLVAAGIFLVVGISFLIHSGQKEATVFRHQAEMCFSWLCAALAAALVIFSFFPAAGVSGSAFGLLLGGTGAFIVMILYTALYVHGKIATVDRHQPAVLRTSETSIGQPQASVGRAPGQKIPEIFTSLEVRRYGIGGLKGKQVGLITGDLRKINFVDVWVNSENTEMRMSSNYDRSISGAIRYLGARRDPAGKVIDDLISDELSAKVAGHTPVIPGVAVLTGSGELWRSNKVRHIVHVAAVQYEYGQGPRQLGGVDHCVMNAMSKADELEAGGSHSILFPLLGAGAGRGDRNSTAAIILSAAVDYLLANRNSHIKTVYFLARTNFALEAFLGAVSKLPVLTLIG